ncbi:hypothetical protein AB433_12970 [Croceicoccus naphthovorans]|uniref:Uncharacterized protein n=1 Tax=Croceicoccus naphthovorans TaxID=1348774 RepID=A0A0G3XHJ8_9SPHN|nr:hypothetical protein AB433_12970 [Croceicoccus naphthovorans]
MAVLTALATLAGCATVETAPVATTPADPAQDIAALLVETEAAYREGQTETLGTKLAELGALGVKPIDDTGEATLAEWSARATLSPHAWRGRVLGPGFLTGTLPARGTRTIEQTFLSGRKAAVAVQSPDGRPVGIRITDDDDEPLCKQEAEKVSCRWVPLYTHRHRIEIYNPGRENVRFYLVID